jgi:ribokinase
VEKVVDTTGAGDSFIGSLAVFLLQLDALPDSNEKDKTKQLEKRREALRRANHIAAISVQGKGTQTSYAKKGDSGIPLEWF